MNEIVRVSAMVRVMGFPYESVPIGCEIAAVTDPLHVPVSIVPAKAFPLSVHVKVLAVESTVTVTSVTVDAKVVFEHIPPLDDERVSVILHEPLGVQAGVDVVLPLPPHADRTIAISITLSSRPIAVSPSLPGRSRKPPGLK
ncbi:hypothetical protein [Anaeromyxobacter oryzisoli]|uniref:hypothetical protein n=1 Tax=Anaeromyxobacter oryzisoli TaxID=2925408 RepID=UPI001F5AC4A1|nr:hypothetical protein [Anaeromyxobacter sp. SG63]